MARIIHDDLTTGSAPLAGTPGYDVTRESRITGVPRERFMGEGRMVGIRDLDWSAVFASVLVGMGLTVMLTILGVATGLISSNHNNTAGDIGGIVGAVGAWTVIAAILGTFAGSFVGGRYSNWLNRGSVVYHSVTAWGLATLLSLALITFVTMGFVSSTSTAASTAAATTNTPAAGTPAAGTPASTTPGNTAGQPGATKDRNGNGSNVDENAAKTANALGGAGVALTIGMLLTLIASVGGWWLGSRKPLTSLEREDDATPVT